MLIEKIKSLTKKFHNDTVASRRHLHMNPELSFQEFNTQKFVEDKLKEYGITNMHRLANTGVVALIEGKNPGKKVVALRADMDALPIIETNAVDYKSKNNGVMHACGHDVHTSSLLGVVRVLNELKNEFEGTVKFIFESMIHFLCLGKKGENQNSIKYHSRNALLYQHQQKVIVCGGFFGVTTYISYKGSDRIGLVIIIKRVGAIT